MTRRAPTSSFIRLQSDSNVRSRRNSQPIPLLIGAIGLLGKLSAALGAAAPQFEFNIDAGSLNQQLIEVGNITGVYLSFPYDLLTNKTPGLHGRYSAAEAVATLAAAGGAECNHVSGTAVLSIELSQHPHPATACLDVPEESSGPMASKADMPLIQVSANPPPTGTHLHDSPPIGSQMITLDQEAIRFSGSADLGELLQIPQNFGGGATQDTHLGAPEALANSSLGVCGNLRGLGGRATLVLRDGIPIAPSGSGASCPDLLQMPLSIIDKIEILPDGASATYGSQAVGGVINIVTLNDYKGPQTHLEIGSVTQGHQERHRISQVLGTRWESGNALVVADLYHRGALFAGDRWQALNLSGSVPYGNPGNLFAADGAAYPIPAGQSGRPLDFASLPPGAPRLSRPEAHASVIPNQTRWSLYTSLQHAFNESIAIWANAQLTERYATQSWGPQVVDLDVTHSPFLLDAPAGGVTEKLNLFDEFGSQRSSVNVRTFIAAMRLQIALPGKWCLVLVGSDSLDTESQLTGKVDPIALQAAIAEPASGQPFNPLGAGPNNSAAVLDNVAAPQWYGSRSQVWSYQAIVDGPVFAFPAGRWRAASGLEFRDQRFTSATSQPLVTSNLRRELYAIFGELQGPLLDAQTSPLPYGRLSMSFAARAEHYSDFGNSLSARGGITWAVTRAFAVLASVGESVRAPDLGDLSERTNSSFMQTLNGTPTLFWAGGNSHLGVERALTYALGLTFTSEESSPHVSAGISYFNVLFKNRIQQVEFSADVLTNPSYAAFVHSPSAELQRMVCENSIFVSGTRQECLQVVPGDIVDLRFNNAGILRTDGVDAQAQMSFDTTLGKFGLQTAATYILHYEQANTPAGQLISTRNRESNPLALNLMGSASWKRGPVVARLGLRRASGYWNMETQPATRVGSWTTTDVGLGYAFGAADSAATQPAEVSLHCSNVFNQYPPFSANIAANIGYDPENGDLTGRVCSLALHVSFSTAGTTRQDLLQ